jgi:threonine/homoserine/homoserine lactone efflux protein
MVAIFAALFGVLTLGLLSPGPDFLLILRNSAGPSRARAFGTVGGIVCGLAAQSVTIALGFAALPAAAMRVLQFGGAAYLAYLGLRALLCRPGPAATGQESESTGALSGFLDGLVCNVTNPKVFIFFVGVFTQVIPPQATLGWRLLVPGAVVLHGLVLWSLIVLALRSSPIAGQLRRAQRWLPRAFGVALLAFAIWLVHGAAVA